MPVSVPIAVGFLQWNFNCDFLTRLVQSNKSMMDDTTPFPISKVLLVDRFVSIGKLERVGNSACAKAPGTVLAIEENSWRVAAADGVVKISDFSDECGHVISAQTVANQSKVTKGEQLPVMTSEQVDRFAKNYTHALSAEPYWKQKLENFERSQISFVRINEIRSPAWTAAEYQISNDYSAIEVLTAWLIYIARDTQMSRIQMGWDATKKWHKDNLTRFIFARTVPFGTTIDLNDTFSSVVSSVKKDCNELVNHLPCLSDTLNHNAVSFNLNDKQQWPMAVSLVNSLNKSEHFIMDGSQLAPHAHGSLMTLQLNSKSRAFRWIYDQNQIYEEEVSCISSRLLALLESAHTDDKANEPVAKLNLLPKAERDLLLYTWNQTTVANPTDRCLHHLFEEQVKRNGRAIAVECNGKTLSYSELNGQANRLAHYLIARGVKSDDRIALCVERSTTMIVAILGILKAGGAYVPLDPVYSSQRLTCILKDADPVLLLTDNVCQKALDGHQIPVVDLNKSLPNDFPIDNLDTIEIGYTPANLAYIIYTSGSTGTPKGVMIEHHDAAQLFMSVREQLNFNDRDKWCLFHSISFDMSVWEIFGALSNGSTLSIAPHDIARSTDEIYDWICAHSITVLTQTPSVFKLMMQSKCISMQSNNLRYVIFGGEALDPSIVTDWNAKFNESQTVLVNMYGPTETAMIATSWICKREVSEDSLAPIGRPLPNKRAYLLDAYGKLVPLGAEGELYIGGAGVARGYLNRPELTAERFLLDPFSDDPTSRMYRTGDRARYLPDGNLLYLGRTDDQVKIRGFRIEIGEIESQLVAHPQVHEAAVQPFGKESDARLVAYVVTDTNSSIAQDLRSYLSSLLPDYMVPAAYVCLHSLPLTPNGKLDRRALPAPGDEAFARQQYEAPQGGIEEKLADIWSDLLSIERISRHDNFFELGGHSLHVMQFSSRAKLSNIHINARGLFSYPILKDLAEQISNCSNRLYVEFAVPIRRFGDLRPMFILPAGDGELKWAFELAHDIDKRFPVYALPWLSPDKKQTSSIEEMAKAMIPHMKKVQSHGPYSILSYCTGGILAYEMAKQLIDNGDAVSFLGLLESYPPDASAPNEADILSDSELFAIFLIKKFIEFETFNDLQWWLRVSKLPLNDAIEEVKKTNINSKAMDVEWDALLSKQCFHFQDMCKAYKIPSLPIKVHLFQALEYMESQSEFLNLLISRKLLNENRKKYDKHSMLGWEDYHLTTDFHVIPVIGDHLSITADPNNRILLAQQISRCLFENE